MRTRSPTYKFYQSLKNTVLYAEHLRSNSLNSQPQVEGNLRCYFSINDATIKNRTEFRIHTAFDVETQMVCLTSCHIKSCTIPKVFIDVHLRWVNLISDSTCGKKAPFRGLRVVIMQLREGFWIDSRQGSKNMKCIQW